LRGAEREPEKKNGKGHCRLVAAQGGEIRKF